MKNKQSVKARQTGFLITFLAFPIIQFIIFYIIVNIGSINLAFQHFDGVKMYSREGDVFFMPAYREYVVDYKGNNEIIVIHFESPVNLPPENFRLDDKGYVSSLFCKLAARGLEGRRDKAERQGVICNNLKA